jgi:WbqC-like protein family
MKTTILQPTYLPWLGYFEMVAASEQFVVFDHVQFEPKSWQQRNKILGPNGEIVLTVPVCSDGTRDVRICDKRIDNKQPWARKHLRSLEVAYRKTPYFNEYFDGIRKVLETRHEQLADLTFELIRHFVGVLGIETRIVRSSDVVTDDDKVLGKTERVVNLCRLVHATTLYDGVAAREFMRIEAFAEHGIEILFQNYVHPQYPQRGSGFVPFMSVVDLLFNCGPSALEILRSGARTLQEPSDHGTEHGVRGHKNFGE